MKIGEICQRTGLTKKAVRYYEEEGLFQPEHQTVNFREYREYTEGDVETLERIAALRALSFSVGEIRQMTEDPERSPEIFQKRREKLREEAEENARQLNFYSRLDFTERPFLDHAFRVLAEEDVPIAPPKKETLTPSALLVLLPGLAAICFPVIRGLLLGESFRASPTAMLAFAAFHFTYRIGMGAAVGYVCLHGREFSDNRPARVSVFLWTALLLVLAGMYLWTYFGGEHSFFLSYLSMDHVFTVLGGYLVMSACMIKGGKTP